ncbi:MAG: HD-GYP domain-containing protein [Lachnospiraceae bacterium]|nr:HD-GYP domain-containing protein [Lachnospiraceae bacterium]
MKQLTPKDLKAGMIVARDVITKQGQTIASTGSTLNSQLIAKLSFYRIAEVWVESDDEPAPAAPEVPNAPAPEPEPIPEPAPAPKEPEPTPVKSEPRNETISYSQRLKTDPVFQDFQLNYSKNIAYLKETFDKIIAGNGASISQNDLLRNAETLFQSKTSMQLFDMLHNMRSLDDTVYAHNINVALVARALGKWLKWPKERLNTLTVAGLLHDIGKTQIPEEVLNKTGSLTDEEFNMIREHPKLGHKLLKTVPHIEPAILYAAMQHHERFDGSGYPRGLPGDEIDDYAAVIAIADVYDAMTATRTYRAPMSAFQVIAAFEHDGYNKYKPQYILTFLSHIAEAYLNNRVILSDGSSATVAYINHNKLSRPMVKKDDGTIIDLSRVGGLEITTCL